MQKRNKFRPLRSVALVVAVVITTAAALIACETPVYRFAMYRWEPAAYSVYYLHEGEPSTDHQAVLDRFAELQFGSDASSAESVNIDVVDVDTSDVDVNVHLPPSVSAVWQEVGSTLPTFLVIAPGGRLLHTGELNLDDANALVDSPARQSASRLLDLEHVAVFYLLESEDDDDANDTARRAIRDVIDLAEAGLLVADEPLSGVLHPDENNGNEDVDATMMLATVSVSRDDPAERWLVRMLLHVEEDLEGLSEPMVFPVFGRGRALEPFIGGGITTDNLTGAVTYVTGSCSCEIKEQNPGMDLLTRWDWATTAEALAERVGEEEGNRGLITETELFPTIIVASGGGIESEDEPPTTTQPEPAGTPTDDATLVAANAADVPTITDAAIDTPPVSAGSTDAATADTSATEATTADWTARVSPEAATDPAAGEASTDFQHRWARNLMLGGGLAVVALVLASLTLLKSRPSA